MKCEEIREQMFDLMTAETPLAAEVQTHLDGCPACSAELASMKQTMALLDEWQAPEPTPFFDTRMQALLREEKTKEATKRSWVLDWFRKPVMAAAAAVALIVGAGVYAGLKNPQVWHPGSNGTIIEASDPAVKDLQTLDKDQDVINNFAALDDDPSNDDQSAGSAE
jgi:predicted anti-sigma-YlaC factor YlaD